jgi:hypothetical protein
VGVRIREVFGVIWDISSSYVGALEYLTLIGFNVGLDAEARRARLDDPLHPIRLYLKRGTLRTRQNCGLV